MSTVMPTLRRSPIRWETWSLDAESDRRFLTIAAIVGGVMVLIGFLISLIHLEVARREDATYAGNRYIELAPEPAAGETAPKAEEPKPSKENSPTPPKQAAPVKTPTKPVEKPVAPVPDKTETARAIAEKSGIKTLQDQLSSLRDPSLNALNNGQPLIAGTFESRGGLQASQSGNPDSIAASAAAQSGGIGGTGSSSVTSTQSGAGVGTRRTNTVTSPLGFGQGHPATGAGGGGKTSSGNRSNSELKLVFDRNASAFYAIFNHAQRENPDMGDGTVTVSLTIAPSGAVTDCHIVSSPFHDPDLERKIVERVKLMNFGAENVPPFTTNYPIIYHPS